MSAPDQGELTRNAGAGAGRNARVLSRAQSLPHFVQEISPPDLTPWQAGNCGIPGFISLDSGQPGPHICVTALTHGNEFAGAIVLDQLLRAGVAPRHGRLTLGFVNLAAFARFDPAQPTVSRFVDEDFNRIWDPDLLDGARRSCELDRARQIRPLIDSVDIMVDLHSMLWPSEPLILCGGTAQGRAVAVSLGVPELVIADHGHLSGLRLIDYPHFADPEAGLGADRGQGADSGRGDGQGAAWGGQRPAAILIESGQHWEAATVATTGAAVVALLRQHARPLPEGLFPEPPAGRKPVRIAEVTNVVTAATAEFAFTAAFHGGEIIARRDTLIATDGAAEVRTPYDDCLLVMPSLRPSRGHTAVRLARLAE